jgi:hypothetical protein
MKMAVASVTQKFAEALNEKFEGKEVTAMSGRKFDRVVIAYSGEDSSRSVHAFVERETGKVFKAAGWKAPAKNARYDLSTDETFAQTVKLADPFGSYLYQR